MIGNVRIYNRSLSSGDVISLYNYEFTNLYCDDTNEASSWLNYLSIALPSSSNFFSSLASNNDFAFSLLKTFTSNPSIYGIIRGPQGIQGPQGFQGQAGVGSPQNLLTNTAFLQALATNQVFLNALASNVLIASKSLQTITFAPIPAQTFKASKTVALKATTSANLPISYTCANPAVGTIIGNVLQLQGSGSTTVTATQVGNQYYNPASAIQPLIVK